MRRSTFLAVLFASASACHSAFAADPSGRGYPINGVELGISGQRSHELATADFGSGPTAAEPEVLSGTPNFLRCEWRSGKGPSEKVLAVILAFESGSVPEDRKAGCSSQKSYVVSVRRYQSVPMTNKSVGEITYDFLKTLGAPVVAEEYPTKDITRRFSWKHPSDQGVEAVAEMGERSNSTIWTFMESLWHEGVSRAAADFMRGVGSDEMSDRA